ncbi:MAG: endonuclease [Synergistaceae bacterium]|nr:endonuclease [Synergistaceae bacterium]
MGIDSERQVRCPVFCGVDPGREKFGIAVGSYGKLFFSAIIPYVKLNLALNYLFTGNSLEVAEWRQEGSPYNFGELRGVFLGDGTFHGEYEKGLRARKIDYVVTDERMTTIEARVLYWRLHPPRALLRLVPIQWRVPPRPIDDLAAWAIMKRALSRT